MHWSTEDKAAPMVWGASMYAVSGLGTNRPRSTFRNASSTLGSASSCTPAQTLGNASFNSGDVEVPLVVIMLHRSHNL